MSADIKVDQVLDAKGLNCPLPILKTKKAVEALSAGQVLEGNFPPSLLQSEARVKRALAGLAVAPYEQEAPFGNLRPLGETPSHAAGRSIGKIHARDVRRPCPRVVEFDPVVVVTGFVLERVGVDRHQLGDVERRALPADDVAIVSLRPAWTVHGDQAYLILRLDIVLHPGTA